MRRDQRPTIQLRSGLDIIGGDPEDDTIAGHRDPAAGIETIRSDRMALDPGAKRVCTVWGAPGPLDQG